MIKKILCIFFLFILITNNLNSQVKNLGLPYIKNYSTKDYRAAAQNWSIYQDNRGVMYFGNTIGLLEFDGNEWRLTELTNKSIVRSICEGENNKIYIGGSDEIGYLDIDSVGQREYHSLLEKIPEEERGFKDVWAIYKIKKSLIFQSFTKIFILEGEKITIIHPENRFHRSYCVNNKFYVREWGKGLSVLKNNKLELVPDGELFADERVDLMLPFSKDEILIGSRTKGLFIYNGKNITPWKTSVDDIIINSQIYSGIKIDDYFAIGTILNGIIIIDKTGKPIQSLTNDKGLCDNTVYSLFLDDQKNLWAALGIGISYIEINSPLTYFDKRNGFDAKCYSALVHDNELYLGGEPYMYFREWLSYDNPFEVKPFVKIDKTAGQTFRLDEINNELFCSRAPDIMIINKNNIRNIHVNNQVVWTIIPVKNNPGLLIVGENDGLYVLQKDNNLWKLKNKINGFNELSRYMVKDENNNYWISVSGKGIYRFQINSTLDSVINIKLYDIEVFFNSSPSNQLIVIDNKVIISASDGFYYYNNSADKFIPYEPFNRLLLKGEPTHLIKQDDKKNVWFSNDNSLGVFLYQSENNYKIFRTPFFKFASTIYTTCLIDSSNVILGEENGFIHYDPTFKKDYNQPFNTLIRKIELPENDSLIYGGNQKDNFNKDISVKTLSFRENSLRFTYVATFYENIEKTQYQYKLEGFDKEWSLWTRETRKDYTKINPGTYTFKVKARNVFQIESKESIYKFVILPPWYQTFWAYLIYILLAASLLYLIIWLNSRRLKIANINLEKAVNERTEKISMQKEEIQTQAVELEEANIELAKLSMVASKTDNSVIIMDAQGNFNWINDGFTRLYGYNLSELYNKFGSNLLEVSTYPKIKSIFNKCITEKVSVSYESSVFSKTGETIWIQTTITPILNEQNSVVKLIAIDSDISKLKEAENEILKQHDELKILNATKDKFFNIIAHDLRNPFNSLLGFSKLLLQNLKNRNFEKSYTFAEIIMNSSLKTFELLEKLLTWSRSQTGKIEIKPENLNIKKLIDNNIDLLKNSAKNKNITLSANLKNSTVVFADSNMVNTVLQNLITNAIKFSNQDDIITINAKETDECVLVSVSDTGVGISPENITKLFKVHENIITKGTAKEPGTGLGLILCKEFIEKHKGKIWAESTLGKGTIFYFTLQKG
ncbi:MAG: PAS domain S-box protein [Bacteroidales bacterium]|nr:PAS domain S-box protein [Bacteroidales bacterium]